MLSKLTGTQTSTQQLVYNRWLNLHHTDLRVLVDARMTLALQNQPPKKEKKKKKNTPRAAPVDFIIRIISQWFLCHEAILQTKSVLKSLSNKAAV